jgi:hypothetical protein
MIKKSKLSYLLSIGFGFPIGFEMVRAKTLTTIVKIKQRIVSVF